MHTNLQSTFRFLPSALVCCLQPNLSFSDYLVAEDSPISLFQSHFPENSLPHRHANSDPKLAFISVLKALLLWPIWLPPMAPRYQPFTLLSLADGNFSWCDSWSVSYLFSLFCSNFYCSCQIFHFIYYSSHHQDFFMSSMCVPHIMHAQVPAKARRGRHIWCFDNGVTGSCERLHVGTGNWAWVFCRTARDS